MPERPGRRRVEAAIELLREVVCDFPFKEESHFAAWLSALLTPLARYTFKGPSPLNLIDANIRGAGKSLLADVCNMIVTGRPAARMSYNRNEEELRKSVTSLALAGAQVVLIERSSWSPSWWARPRRARSSRRSRAPRRTSTGPCGRRSPS